MELLITQMHNNGTFVLVNLYLKEDNSSLGLKDDFSRISRSFLASSCEQ